MLVVAITIRIMMMTGVVSLINCYDDSDTDERDVMTMK